MCVCVGHGRRREAHSVPVGCCPSGTFMLGKKAGKNETSDTSFLPVHRCACAIGSSDLVAVRKRGATRRGQICCPGEGG